MSRALKAVCATVRQAASVLQQQSSVSLRKRNAFDTGYGYYSRKLLNKRGAFYNGRWFCYKCITRGMEVIQFDDPECWKIVDEKATGAFYSETALSQNESAAHFES